ncbi:hypothetical protein ADK82_25070 [Streptomyces sp. NRRL S-4]|nr:hypothetical protein ADK82_25070 [Streptomyces sp. NRRL S-4]
MLSVAVDLFTLRHLVAGGYHVDDQGGRVGVSTAVLLPEFDIDGEFLLRVICRQLPVSVTSLNASAIRFAYPMALP